MDFFYKTKSWFDYLRSARSHELVDLFNLEPSVGIIIIYCDTDTSRIVSVSRDPKEDVIEVAQGSELQVWTLPVIMDHFMSKRCVVRNVHIFVENPVRGKTTEEDTT